MCRYTEHNTADNVLHTCEQVTVNPRWVLTHDTVPALMVNSRVTSGACGRSSIFNSVTIKNADVRHITEPQSPLSCTVNSQHLSLFGHVGRQKWTKYSLSAHCSSGQSCSTWLRNTTDDLSSFDMGLLKAIDVVMHDACWYCIGQWLLRHIKTILTTQR